MLKSSLCEYGDAYILFRGTISVKNSAKDIDTVMSMYNLIEYSDN